MSDSLVYQVFSVRDRVSETFSPPFFSLNVSTATREIRRVASDPSSQMHFSPIDYDLYLIGNFDAGSGNLLQLDKTIIKNVLDLIQEYNEKHPRKE